MTEQQQNTNEQSLAAASPIPTAPPTVPGMRPVAPPTWPSVLGVIGIIYSIGGFLASAWQVVAAVFFELRESMLPPGAQASQAASISDSAWVPISATLSTLLCGVAIALFIGSFGLIKLRPWSRRLLLSWAVVRIGLALVDSVISYMLGVAILEASPYASPVPAFAINWTLMVGACFEWMLYSAFPVYLLIWLNLAGPKREMQRWRQVPRE
jgi:hypothetical protein